MLKKIVIAFSLIASNQAALGQEIIIAQKVRELHNLIILKDSTRAAAGLFALFSVPAITLSLSAYNPPEESDDILAKAARRIQTFFQMNKNEIEIKKNTGLDHYTFGALPIVGVAAVVAYQYYSVHCYSKQIKKLTKEIAQLAVEALQRNEVSSLDELLIKVDHELQEDEEKEFLEKVVLSIDMEALQKELQHS